MVPSLRIPVRTFTVAPFRVLEATMFSFRVRAIRTGRRIAMLAPAATSSVTTSSLLPKEPPRVGWMTRTL